MSDRQRISPERVLGARASLPASVLRTLAQACDTVKSNVRACGAHGGQGCPRSQEDHTNFQTAITTFIERGAREAREHQEFPLGWLILWLLLALSLWPSLTRAQQSPQASLRSASTEASIPAPALVDAVDAIGMTVSDMDRAVEFYSKVLSFEKVSDAEVAGEDYERLEGVFGLRMRVVRMRLGDEVIELTEYLAPKGRPVPVDSRSNDRWFQHIAIITSDMDRAYAWLRRNRVEHASSGPQRIPDWNRAAAGIRAFYFKDPDEHTLEILEFPSDKGAPKWHRGGDRLFLGIDHTAIVVSDTEASLKFYRDLLGFRVAGESENYGTEQEHLNNVFGARLRITSLRAGAGGPAIEFLEYLAPRDGRPVPADTRASDLVYWQTRLIARDVDRAAQSLLAGRLAFISTGVVTVPEKTLGFSRALLVRDPDGHAMQIVKR
jgi:catechol 2,3-dioxygenase-like lactoylglutathione lyase family enzyme